MLTVDDYGAIRRARRDGKSIRQIASDFQHSRNTVRKILKQAEPNPIPSTRNRFAPRLGPVQSIIDQILIDPNFAALGFFQTCNAAKSGGLPGACGSQEHEEFLIMYLERNIAHCGDVAVGLR